MKEPTQVSITTEEMILSIVQSLDAKVDGLEAGQTKIREDLATHEERSRNQATRIERVERAGGAITLALIVALFGVFMSGCGLVSKLLTPPVVQDVPSGPVVNVVKRAVQSTVAFHTATGDRYCSGVASEGMIITAEHCVHGEDVVGFKVMYKGKFYPGVVIKSVEKNDLAFVDAVGARMQDTVPFAKKDVVLGNKVIWTGYPLGQDFMMGNGIVGNPSYYSPLLGEEEWLAVYGQFIPGNSGGPVFNTKGELVGIISMTMTASGQFLPVGWAVPLSVLKANL